MAYPAANNNHGDYDNGLTMQMDMDESQMQQQQQQQQQLHPQQQRQASLRSASTVSRKNFRRWGITEQYLYLLGKLNMLMASVWELRSQKYTQSVLYMVSMRT